MKTTDAIRLLRATLDEQRVKLTILHEVAHALTEGHGHSIVWRRKCLEIGGDGQYSY